VEFLRPGRSELVPKKQANLGGLGTEQLGQGLHVVALARQSRLQIIDILGDDRIDEFGADRLLADFVTLFQSAVQMPFDLQGCSQSLRKARQASSVTMVWIAVFGAAHC
jgi:hypothetical protein